MKRERSPDKGHLRGPHHPGPYHHGGPEAKRPYGAPPDRRGYSGAGAGGPAGRPAMARELPQEPSILQEMVVGRRNIGKVIGPGGEVAASIRKATRCQLHVVPHVNRQDDTQIVEISGTAQQVKDGVAKVLEILGDSEDSRPRMPKQAFTYFDVLPEMVGYVLGTRGSTVKAIKEKTRTNVQISDVHPETGLQAITITGPPDNIAEAYATILKMFERYDPRRTKPPPVGVHPPPAYGAPPPAYGAPPGHPPPQPGYAAPDPYGRPPVPAGPPPAYGRPPVPAGAPHDRPPYGAEADPYGHPGVDYRRAPDHGRPQAYGAPAHADAYHRPPSPQRYSTRPSDPRLAAAAPAPVHAPAPAASHVAAAGAEPPKLLVLHSDGTYRPAQIVMPQGQVAAAAPMPAASAAPAATTLTASAGAAVGADPRQGAANNLGFNGQQLLATLQQALLAQAAHQQQMQGSSAATQAGQAAYGGAAGTTAAPGTQASTQQVTYSYAQPGQAQLYGQVPAASATTTATQAQPYATQATTGQAYAPAQTYGQQGTYAAQTQNYATTAYTTTAAAPAAGTAAAGTTSATTQQPAATYAQAYQQWYPQQYLQSQQQQQQPSTR